MKSATVSLKLYFLVLLFTSVAFLIFVSSKTFAIEGDPVNISPVGEIDISKYPNGIEFKWEPASGAKKYRLHGINDEIFRLRTTDTKITIPLNNFRIGNTYEWWVVALDDNDNVISGSQGTRIKIVQPEHDAQCVAVYINGTGVPNTQFYPTPMKPGERFRVDIKVKNTGSKAWKASENYRLGSSGADSRWYDNTDYGLNRVELPRNQTTVEPGSEVIFSFDLTAPSDVEIIKKVGGTAWQMLRERQVDSSGKVIDAGGRFGQLCGAQITIAADGATPGQISDSDVLPVTKCIDPNANTQEVSVRWKNVSGANSYQVNLFEPGGAIGGINCVNKDAAKNDVFTFQFPPNRDKRYYPYSADKTYTVGVAPSTQTNCDGGYISAGNKIPVLNGIAGALLSKDSKLYRISGVSFKNAANQVADYPINSCKTFSYKISQTAKPNDKVPVKIKVDKKVVDSKTQSEMGQVSSSEITVYFKYVPSFGGSEGEN